MAGEKDPLRAWRHEGGHQSLGVNLLVTDRPEGSGHSTGLAVLPCGQRVEGKRRLGKDALQGEASSEWQVLLKNFLLRGNEDQQGPAGTWMRRIVGESTAVLLQLIKSAQHSDSQVRGTRE